MSSNIKKLGEVLNARMRQTAGAAVQTGLEMGTILANLSLKTDGMSAPIPKGDYMISRELVYGNAGDVLTRTKGGQGQHPHGPSGGHSQYSGSGVHSHPADEGEHIHDVLIPESMRAIRPGDRVLVAWCGNEPVVIAKVVAS